MFIGREMELDILEREYSKEGFGLFIMYGRRRVGKSSILKQFAKDKEHIFFTAIKGGYEQNLVKLRKLVGTKCDISPNSDLTEILEAISALNGKLSLIIDEFPYLAESNKAVPSILQNFIDDNEDSTNLFMVLCGSSMSFMLNEVLGAKSPLYGRRTAQYKVQPLGYKESARFLSGFSNQNKMKIYGMVGGIPMYLLLFDANKSLEENIKELFLTPGCILPSEPEFIMMEEMRVPRTFNDILAVLSDGKFRLNEISNSSYSETSTTSNKLRDLMFIDIVSKKYPFGEKNGKTTGYVINDNLIKFCYKFLHPYDTPITDSERDIALNRIMAGLPSYVGEIFERMCREYVRYTMGYDVVDSWWGTDKTTKTLEKIDIVAIKSDNPDTILFGECKCKNKKTDSSVVADLIRKSKLIKAENKKYVIFSCYGFDNNMDENCIDLDMMYV